MSAIVRLIVSNWPLKLTALGLATVLYMGVAISQSTQTWSGPVAIEVLNPPAGGALLSDPGVVDRIEFQAPDGVAAALTNDSFRASIDLRSVQPRPGATTVEVPVRVYPVDPRVRVVSYEPPGVIVQVDEVVSQVIPVTIEHGPVPEGIQVGPVSVEPALARISGASSRVQNVRSVGGHFVIDASGISIDEEVELEAYDEVGAIVPGVDVEPRSARVKVAVARQLAYGTVPVIPELVGEPAHGMRVDNVSVVPATVTVSGESSDIRQLDSLTTGPVDISGQSVELVTDAPLVLPDGITTNGEPSVSVIVTFTDAVGSRRYEVGTSLTGVQPGYSYRLGVPSVDVILSGSVRQLDELTPDQLEADIPVADLQVGDNEVMPVVEAPRGTSLVSITPESVTVTVTAAP